MQTADENCANRELNLDRDNIGALSLRGVCTDRFEESLTQNKALECHRSDRRRYFQEQGKAAAAANM